MTHLLLHPRSWLFLALLLFGAATGAGAADLVGSLTSNLGVTPAQASGGAGAIFNLAKDRLSPTDFLQVSNTVPGIDGLMAAAPKPSQGGGGLLGGAASALGGLGGNLGGLGSLAGLAGPFSQLGMKPDMVGKFVPVVLDYVKTSGGDATMGLLKGALSGK